MKKKDDSNTIPIQCECGKFKDVAVGTKDAICDDCQRGMEITWQIEDINLEEVDEKCYEVSYYHPYGGATSFDEADAWREAQSTAMAISSAKHMFDGIYDNIWQDDDKSPDEKIQSTEQAMKDMVSRMQNPEADANKSLIGRGKDAEEETGHCPSYLSFSKDSRGNLRWLALFSNRFQDREKEIFSEKAHREYEAWVDKQKMYPELRIWHMPGTGLGRADSVTYADGFMVATGTFYAKSLDVAEKLAGMDDLGISHGYLYRPKDLSGEGVYRRYRTFELSVLPLKHASNSWTAFTLESLQKEVAMGLDEKKRPFFVELLGEERVKALETTLPKLSKDLEEAGVAWKDLTEALDSDGDTGSDSTSDDGGEDKTGETDDGGGEDKTGDTGGEDKTGNDGGSKDKTGDADEGDKALEGLKEVLAPFAESIKTLEETVKELQKSDDEKIAGRMQQGQAGNGKRPSDSDDNTIDENQTKDLDKPDGDQEVGSQTAAARSIVDELLLGKKPQS